MLHPFPTSAVIRGVSVSFAGGNESAPHSKRAMDSANVPREAARKSSLFAAASMCKLLCKR
jgi:hypothetical protein